MKGEVLIAGAAGVLIGALAVSLLMAGPGVRLQAGSEQAIWRWAYQGSGGYGMMGRGMMGAGMTGPGMMPGTMGIHRSGSVPISRSEAEQRAAEFARRFGEGYVAEDLMEFTENYYAVIEEEKSGTAIAEALVDRYTGLVTLEPGPSMLWRIRSDVSSGQAAYDREAARSVGENFLGGYLPGARILESHTLPGYYTFDFGRNGAEGMLSVNAYSGAIWVHTWHGLPLAHS